MPAGGYADKVLSTQAAYLIAYWPLWEASGSNAENLEGTAARDGTYTGVTLGQPGIGDGRTCPLFDGANDYVNIYTTSLRDAFNGTSGTLALWAKVYNLAVWTDSTLRTMMILRADASNHILPYKSTTDDTLSWLYKAGGTAEARNNDAVTLTTWMHLAVTWCVVADEIKFYLNGVQDGSTQTGLGTWAGTLHAQRTLIGAGNTVGPAGLWHGWLMHPAIWTTPLTDAEISNLWVV